MSEVKKQASNIDEQGNVLYLDQERLDRKEVGFPPYQNKSNGLGIYNWLVEHVVYMSDKRWPLILKLYHVFVRFSKWMKEGGRKARFYKKAIMLYPDMEAHTGTIVMPLDEDLTKYSPGSANALHKKWEAIALDSLLNPKSKWTYRKVCRRSRLLRRKGCFRRER